MNFRKRVTEARLKKAAKIYALAIITETSGTEHGGNKGEYAQWIREEAAKFADLELKKLGVTEFIGSEQAALNFVLRSNI